MNLFQAFKMSCRDATYLHGKKQEEKLSLADALGLKIHLLYCGLCRLFFKQLDVLEEQAHIFSHSDEPVNNLDSSSKEKMQKAFDEELKQ